MPYPSKLDAETLINVAFEMIEEEGVDAFSMHKLAAAFGVKAASLYRYFNKAALLQAVNTRTYQNVLQVFYQAAEQPGDPAARFVAGITAMRDYAHTHTTTYVLAFSNTDDSLRPDEVAAEQAVLPLQALMAQITGDDVALAALRGLQAIGHGFIMLELAGQYRRGGDLDAHFNQVAWAYLNGWRK
ncbi:TetR/AcrR family transcriptional regulator [Phototrophicus methaneseepsis]|uniref:TetR/AcrR family transcriptional regulator n=1 Tax=Phototrophicus methaneseepsis TaxID=2710758 RepID=A0A7S8EBI5_9CHLR|nr:TetR/AcrR family transcriptional regulator [Phototrophicus methaneseepsis]QPC83874.1 TetR/AcrR family transcriptional regulator [Phototrophicus methaneseepsis]